MSALSLAGYEVELASRFIAYSKREAGEILEQRKQGALIEADRIIADLRNDPPHLWLTYHPYCKAPDWVGPRVCEALNIPYVTVEAARTGQGFENGGDRWAKWRSEAQMGIRKADLHLAFKPTDRDYLTSLLGSGDQVVMISPFISTNVEEPLPEVSLPNHWRASIPTIVTVGMMRPGKKLENYKIMAKVLALLQALHWNMILIGGGPAEPEIRNLFSPFDPARLHFAGTLDHSSVLSHMAASDLFLWPGWKEPIGMVYLEAQLMGLPVAAMDSMGVSLSVHHGTTGLLSEEGDVKGLCTNMSTLLSHPTLRRDLGQAAKQSVQKSHSLQAAARALQHALEPLIQNR